MLMKNILKLFHYEVKSMSFMVNQLLMFFSNENVKLIAMYNFTCSFLIIISLGSLLQGT